MIGPRGVLITGDSLIPALESGRKIINGRLQPTHNLGAGEPLRPSESCHHHLDVTPIARDELRDRQGRLLGRLTQGTQEAGVDEHEVTGELPHTPVR